MAAKGFGLLTVILALEKRAPLVLVQATGVVDAMSVSPWFKTPPIAYVTVTSNVGTLTTAEGAMKLRTAGLKAKRDAALAVVITNLKQLHGYVQQVVIANPTEAANIAAAAGMRLRKVPNRSKGNLTVKQGVSGTVHLVARSVKGARAHDWQYSADGGKTWVGIPPTSQSHATISNLPPGLLAQFRARVVTKTGASDWTSPVVMAVS
jgi:hypothetical protein